MLVFFNRTLTPGSGAPFESVTRPRISCGGTSRSNFRFSVALNLLWDPRGSRPSEFIPKLAVKERKMTPFTRLAVLRTETGILLLNNGYNFLIVFYLVRFVRVKNATSETPHSVSLI